MEIEQSRLVDLLTGAVAEAVSESRNLIEGIVIDALAETVYEVEDRLGRDGSRILKGVRALRSETLLNEQIELWEQWRDRKPAEGGGALERWERKLASWNREDLLEEDLVRRLKEWAVDPRPSEEPIGEQEKRFVEVLTHTVARALSRERDSIRDVVAESLLDAFEDIEPAVGHKRSSRTRSTGARKK